MLVKIVSTIATTDSAGKVVESIPVRVAGAAEVNSVGQPILITAASQDANGVPVRVVAGVTTVNSIGQPVDSRPMTGLAIAPVNTVLPAISGNAYVGSTLTSSTGTWLNGVDSYSYQWKSNGSNVGTNQNTYVPVSGDIGHTITCTVTATNAAASVSATSSVTAAVIATPANTVLPAISGTASQGQTLTSSTGTWSGGGSIAYTYQWKADGTNISAATASTYLLTASEVGKVITCAVTATNAAGNATATSAATSAVVALGTLNPSDKSANITLSNGNLRATGNSGGPWMSVRSQTSHSGGKYYWEWTVGQKGANQGLAGFANATESLASYIGADNNGIGLITNGNTAINAVFNPSGIAAMSDGDMACFAIDLTNHLFWVRKGGGDWNGNAANNPATGVGGIATPTGVNSGAVFAGISICFATDFSTANFGASAFSQAMPSGFSAWG